MNNSRWSAIDWCLMILTSTIPVTMVGVIVVRLVTGQPISGEAAEIIKVMLNIVAGGVIGILAGKMATKKEEDKNGNDENNLRSN